MSRGWMLRWHKAVYAVTLLMAALLGSCSLFRSKTEKEVMARVGTKTITVNELIRRAEYTIRPSYASGTTNVHKKIVLNSLIAEKMLALESEKAGLLANNEKFMNYIQGRQEQAMRQWLFKKEGTEKVKLESEDVRKTYNLAGRRYRIQYFNVPAGRISGEVQFQLQTEKMSFDSVFHELFGEDEIPEKEVDWNSAGHETVHSALFGDRLEKGQIIGPLSVEDDRNMFIRIGGWSDRLAITDADIRKRNREVTDKLTETSAARIYGSFTGRVMRGKRIEFDPGTFNTLAEIMAPLYLKPRKEKEEIFLDVVFERNGQNLQAENFDRTVEQIREQSFCRINGDVWSVEDFLAELERHPLVFRKREIRADEFAEQFKLAAVDLVRDWHLTREAYARGYEKVESVKNYTDMWREADLAQYYRQKYLESVIPPGIDSLSFMKVIEKYLNPHIDSLQSVYDSQIEVNVRAFEEVQLTRVDMFVLQGNVPFPIVVPSFPQLTTDHELDYGRVMKGTEIRKTEKPGS